MVSRLLALTLLTYSWEKLPGLSVPVGYIALAPSCLQDAPKRVDLSLDDKKTFGKYQVNQDVCGTLFPPGHVVELSSETSKVGADSKDRSGGGRKTGWGKRIEGSVIIPSEL
jgi:hypothetical protein